MNSKLSMIAGMGLCIIFTGCGGDLIDYKSPSSDADDTRVNEPTEPSPAPTTTATPAPSDSPPTLAPEPSPAPPSLEPTAIPQPASPQPALPEPTQVPEPSPGPAPTDTPVYSALIQWDIPTARENGDDLLLSEISGYEVYFKMREAAEYQKEAIDMATTSEIRIVGLQPGVYQMYITTLDTDGLRSQHSPLLTAEIGD